MILFLFKIRTCQNFLNPGMQLWFYCIFVLHVVYWALMCFSLEMKLCFNNHCSWHSTQRGDRICPLENTGNWLHGEYFCSHRVLEASMHYPGWDTIISLKWTPAINLADIPVSSYSSHIPSRSCWVFLALQFLSGMKYARKGTKNVRAEWDLPEWGLEATCCQWLLKKGRKR